MVKFQFSILTQNRLKIDNIAIMGRNQEDAERKLRQMYRYCEVLSCEVKAGVTKAESLNCDVNPGSAKPVQKAPVEDKTSMEDILTLISN
ncbi:hypothetical protein [Noviherbaspirillum massiliense]|uniref:hypothetical protein n=1 Tax=Noviherbaspirillum massiliense TaxID=1465823 RepID=UPI00031AFDC9|nr:hypothetical protein [Noviherbaspirillum massiliense]